MCDVTQILGKIESGDPSAAEQLLPLVYEELRKLAAVKMAQEKPDQTLQATALVHEAYIRPVDVPLHTTPSCNADQEHNHSRNSNHHGGLEGREHEPNPSIPLVEYLRPQPQFLLFPDEPHPLLTLLLVHLLSFMRLK